MKEPSRFPPSNATDCPAVKEPEATVKLAATLLALDLEVIMETALIAIPPPFAAKAPKFPKADIELDIEGLDLIVTGKSLKIYAELAPNACPPLDKVKLCSLEEAIIL